MSYRRRVLYFSVFLVLVLSSCAPGLSDGPDKNVDGDIRVPDECTRNGYPTHIMGGSEYCFSYPTGYSLEEESTLESVTYSYDSVGSVPASTEGIDDMEAFEQAVLERVTLHISYEDRHENDDLDRLVTIKGEDFESPWFLDNEEAILLRTNNGNTYSYVVHAKHGDNYYQVEFTSSTGLSGNMEELFFTVLATFNFIK